MSETSVAAATPHGAAPGRAALLIISSALGFSLIATFTLLATREGTTLTMVLLGRYVVASVLLLPALRWLRANPLDGARLAQLIVAGGVGQAIVATLSLAALAFIPVSTLVFLFYTYPGWVTLLAAVRRLERLDARKLFALGLSLAGVGCMVGLPGAAAIHPAGLALALSAALAYAAYIPLMGHLQRGVDPAFTSLCISAGVSVVFLVATVTRGEFTLQLPLVAWGAIFALGALCTAIAFRLFLTGLATLGPVRTAIISTVEPIFAALGARVVLGQAITLPVVGGGTLILAAVLLLQTGSARREAKAAPA